MFLLSQTHFQFIITKFLIDGGLVCIWITAFITIITDIAIMSRLKAF